MDGYIAPLAETGPRRGPQNVFINGRLVRDKTFAHAIGDAYSVASIKERSPEVHLFIEMPLDALDVNVHPTKAEVRFREQSLMHQVVRRALGDALGQGPAPTLSLSPTASPSAYPVGRRCRSRGCWRAAFYPSRWRPDRRRLRSRAGPGSRLRAGSGLSPSHPALRTRLRHEPEHKHSALSTSLIPLGQFRDTFIIAVDHEGVAIIDQHVAHERVLYDGRSRADRRPSGESAAADTRFSWTCRQPAGKRWCHAPPSQRLGFEVEEFGGEAVKVSALPALLGVERRRPRCARWPRTSKASIAAARRRRR